MPHQLWSDAQAHFLAAAGSVLAASLDYEQILAQIAKLAVPTLGDWCSVALAEPGRPLRRVAMACADPAMRPLAEAICRLPLSEQNTYAYTEVLASGEPALLEYPADLTELQNWLHTAPAHFTLTQQMAPRLSYTVPLKVHGQTYGAITYTMTTSGRGFTPERRALAEELARRIAIAVDNALLYRGAQRRLAELTTVQQVARMVSGALNLDQICRTVVMQTSAAFGYRMISIYLREGDVLLLQAELGYRDVLERISIDQGVIGRVARQGQAQFVRDAASDPDFLFAVAEIQQGIFVPLRYADGPTLGVLGIESTGDPRLNDDDLRILTLLADQLSVALINARLFLRLEDAASRWRALVETATNVVICLDPVLRVTEFNQRAEQIFGVSREQALGQDYLHTFVAPQDRITLAGLAAMALSGQPPRPLELVVERDDGALQTLLWTLSCRRGSNGAPTELLIVGQDITERREAEQARLAVERKMLEAQRLESLGVLVGGIAHDFNNLLAAILGNASLLLLDLPPESDAFHSACQIEVITQRAAELVGQMLAYAGRGYFQLQPLDLNALVNEMTVLLHASMRKTALLHEQLDADLPPVEADAAQIRQVVMNLIVNASEALAPEGGEITLTTASRYVRVADLADAVVGAEHPAGWYVALDVRDNGSGMDASTLPRIFEPFFSTKFTGRGLGLAAVLGIVRSHNGALLVQSTPGQGSCFTVLLPALLEASLQPVAQASAPPRLPPIVRYDRPLVLIIDDEDEVRAMIARVLEREGFATAGAPDGEQGLALSRRLAARLGAVVVDLTMPRLNGQQVFYHLRQERPNLPVILISGFTAEEIAHRFGTQRPDAIIQKPFDPHTLLGVLRQLIPPPEP
ncbi:MAG: GAF domain-containing protein [Oscillochloridaceae bacterium umkhey_bin13]